MIEPYFQDEFVTLYCADCRDVLPQLGAAPQSGAGSVDLVLTDPPYGLNEGNSAKRNRSRVARGLKKDYPLYDWDKETVPQELIDSLIQQPAIIFGGNYYAMPPSSCWLVWDKHTNGDFADCELAWTNLPGAVRKIDYVWNGFRRKRPEPRWHCTQKPLDVMKWCIAQADTKLKRKVATILDPFAGSGTTLVAAKAMGRRSIGIERERDYCQIIVERLRQGVLFEPIEVSDDRKKRFSGPDAARRSRADLFTATG